MVDVVDRFIEGKPNMTYTLNEEKMKIEVRGNHSIENKVMLMLQFMECINTIEYMKCLTTISIY
jgi:hypothetical protein